MTTASLSTDTIATDAIAAQAALVPYVTPAEAQQLAQEELRRLLALLETLDETDWARPTACTEWSVRDMVAHQAGAYASGTGYRELLHQYTAILSLRGLPEDAINRRQLADRALHSPAELIDEIRRTGDRAVANWAYGFRLLKPLGMPHPTGGWLTLRHLMLAVHSRDTWIHRLDICRATGRPFERTQEHDGRINALVVRDLARPLARKLRSTAIVLDLTGIGGGSWKIGKGNAEATIRMNVLDFNIYASGRFSYAEAVTGTQFVGDRQLADLAFRHIAVLY